MLRAIVNVVKFTVRMRTSAYNNITVYMLSRSCCIVSFSYCTYHVVLTLCHVYCTCDRILKSDNQIELISVVVFGSVVWLRIQPHHRTKHNDVF